MDYGQEELVAKAESPRHLTISEQLEAKRRTLEAELAKVVKAELLLKKNPEIAEFLDVVGMSLGRLRI